MEFAPKIGASEQKIWFLLGGGGRVQFEREPPGAE